MKGAAAAGLFGAGYLANERLGEEEQDKSLDELQNNNSSDSPGVSEGAFGDAGSTPDTATRTEKPTASETETEEPTATREKSTPTETDTPTDTHTDTPTDAPTETRTGTPSYEVARQNQYGWRTEGALTNETGFCYLDGYLGTKDAGDIEDLLEPDEISGEDPNNALTADEINMDWDDITPVDGEYAIDVDKKQGDESQFYVQLVGQEDGGLYITRQGAYEISNLEWKEKFNSC